MESQLASLTNPGEIEALLQRLHVDDGSAPGVVEQLAARIEDVRPELMIRHALGLSPQLGMTLIDLLAQTRLPPDFSELDFDPGEIGDPRLQISLMRYIAKANVPGSAELLARFLDVSDELVQRETLKALGNLETDLDASILMAHDDSMPAAGADTAADIPGRPTTDATAAADKQAASRLAENSLGKFTGAAPAAGEAAHNETGLVDILLSDDIDLSHTMMPPEMTISPTLEAIRPGSVWLGRYQIKRLIGRGAMGKAVLARDTVVDEAVVLKFMRPELVMDGESVERFRREVKYARRIGHRNVIRVHDLLIQESLCAISMEYFESRGLDRILRRMGALSVRDGLKILYQVCNGMAAAHQQSVVHRDLKPSNILIGKAGLLKVVDFGIASVDHSADSTLSKVGSVVGSPAYLAPERLSHDIADERCDIYSLGIVGYYLFSGGLPYDGDLNSILAAHQFGNAPPLNRVKADVPPAIAELIASMMAVDPDDRPASMLEVRAVVSAMLD